MKNVLYLDCFSGISGDMILGAFIDAGLDFTHLLKKIKKLKLAEKCFLRTMEINPAFRQGNEALKELRQPKKKESIFKRKIF